MKNDNNFRNYMADDPYLKAHAGIAAPIADSKNKNFCACGLNATGGTDVEVPDPEEDVKTKVRRITMWNYAKTAFALIGIFVIAKIVYTKYIKK